MVKTKVSLLRFLGTVDPFDIQDNPLPIKGISKNDLVLLIDEGKLYVFVVVTGTIEEPEPQSKEVEQSGTVQDSEN